MKLKKLLVAIIGSSFVFGTTVGCSSTTSEPETETVDTGSMLATKLADASDSEISTTKVKLHASSTGMKLSLKEDSQMDDIQYVMIYNPLIYESDAENELSTGDMSKEIVTGSNRSGGLDSVFETPNVYSTDDINKDSKVDDATVKETKGGLDPVYAKGDKKDFYYSQTLSNSDRIQGTYKCIYEGENCYVWSIDDCVSETSAQKLGKEFDEVIYPSDKNNFGSARFTENGGKVNLLFHTMSMEGLLGYFSWSDIYASDEVTEDEIESYKLNTDNAIVNINADYIESDYELVCSTVAHEFQHLICASDCFTKTNNLNYMQTWLNEAMSAYAEESTYPGIKEENSYNELLYLSSNYQEGQSLYNFSTANDPYIGAYGAVYLYSQYISALGGDDVFSKVHSYWRTSESSVPTEAESLIYSLPSSVVKTIDQAYQYPSSIQNSFASDEEEWMSKLTLDFYLETLSMDLANLNGLEDQAHLAMLYSDVDAASIQGGGRVLVALNGGKFEIPKDADSGLIYIGLDKDFNVVSSIE